MYLDDIKLFTKNEKESETLIQAVRIFSHKKCAMLIIKSEKRHKTEGLELPNQDKIITFGEMETYKYLGILEADTIKHAKMKKKNSKKRIPQICVKKRRKKIH